jgi:hypothetical protein
LKEQPLRDEHGQDIYARRSFGDICEHWGIERISADGRQAGEFDRLFDGGNEKRKWNNRDVSMPMCSRYGRKALQMAANPLQKQVVERPVC